MKSRVIENENGRMKEFMPLLDSLTFAVTVSQFYRGNKWQPATISYPSSQLSNEQVLKLARALTAAAHLAIEWTNNPPKASV